MGTEKIRKAFYIEEELLGQVDALLPQADVRSRNEFVNRALPFHNYLCKFVLSAARCPALLFFHKSAPLHKNRAHRFVFYTL